MRSRDNPGTAYFPGLFAVILSGAVLVFGDAGGVGIGGPAFFSFFAVPFIMLGAILVRQQRQIEELRSRVPVEPQN